jgi:signal transduction histidine kinase/CheY-like chemotaxis protein
MRNSRSNHRRQSRALHIDTLMNRDTTDSFNFFGECGEMAERMRAHDWANSPLGTPSSWPESLRLVLGVCLGSHFPMAIWWGPDLIQFYNDAYRPILGSHKHPAALGRDARETWPEIWPEIGPMVDRVMSRGQAIKGDDMALVMDRNGYAERCFFTFSYSPVRDATGAVVGMLIAAIETTARVLLERRQAFQLVLADRLRGLADPDEITYSTCRLLAEHVKAARVGYADIDEAAGLLWVRQGWTDGTVTSVAGETLPMRAFGQWIVEELRTGRIVRIDDVAADSRFAESQDIFQRLGVRAMLVVPLVRNGQIISVLSVGIVAPHRWSDEEAALAEDSAERTRAAVERAIAESALKNQLAMERDRLHTLFDQAPGFMAVLREPDHVFELVNTAYRRLVGGRELLGLPVREAVPEVSGQGFFEALDEVVASGKAFSAMEAPALIQQTPGGPLTQCYLDFVYQPVIESDGTVSAVFVEGYDVTQRKLAGDALRESDRRKDEFLAMLAHELRNPLAPISAASELMGQVQLDEAALKRTSAVIARQVRHMTGLIDDLLDVSRVTRGLVVLNKSTQELKGIVSSAIEQARPAIEARHHALAVHLAPEPAHVFGDHKRLVQILVNLLNNAAKFTPDNGKIDLAMKVSERKITLDVTDNGIGIAPELQPHVFDLFAQAERSPDRSQGGLGLGLALVKSLVELHGGTVACQSAGVGSGSRFSVSLPRCSEGDATCNRRQDQSPVHKAGSALRIMIVDDNVDAAQMLAMYLAAVGHQTVVEHDSREVLARVRTEAPDVFLLDIGMPEIDGNTLARQIRSWPETARAVLVAITGYGQEHDRAAAFSAGFDHHLVKPVDMERLTAILSSR